MEEYEVEVFLSGRMICSVLSDSRSGAEEIAQNRVSTALSNIDTDYVYFGSIIAEAGYQIKDKEYFQTEEEDQWNGPKR